MSRKITGLALCVALASGAFVRAQIAMTTPAAHFGFELAADGKFAMWEDEVAYYQKLARESDRIQLRELGKSTQGRPFLLLTVSSPQNLAKAERYKEISRRLADPRGLTPRQIDALVAEGRAVVLVTLGLHSTEVASAQMGPRLMYRLATSNDDQTRAILDNTIFLLIPSFNPDGQDIVGEWFKKTAGTPYEGSGPPELYGEYIGHDNNRDGYMLTQPESQLWAKVVYQEWYPQIYKDTHQQGSFGARITIPPKYDPINPHVDPLIWRSSQLLGGAMGTTLEAEGVTGVESQVHYDAWFMASFHGVSNLSNITSFHTESASAKMIWPLYIHPQQIVPGSRGRPENKAQMTFPHPWPGGWWRQSDIARQQEIETLALVEAAGRYRQNFLRNRALAASRQVEKGATEAPYGHVIPMNQHDPGAAVTFASTLMRSGVEVHRAAERFTTGGRVVEAGDLVIRLDQPSRALVKTMIEPMVYPDNEWTRARDGSPLPPYDMASFTLGDHMGVESFSLDDKIAAKLEKLTAPPRLTGKITGTGSAGWLLTPAWNDSFRAVNRVLRNGGSVYRLPNPPEPWAPGTFWIAATGSTNAAAVLALATEFGLPFTAVPAAPAGPMSQLKPLRVGLYRRFAGGNIDEGWTRFLFDKWEFPYSRVDADEIRKGGLNAKYDALMIADDTVRAIVGVQGEAASSPYAGAGYPAEYSKTLGNAGVDALKEFVRNGGSLVLLNNATALAMERFGIPARNSLERLSDKEFYSPGSSLRVHVDLSQPLGYGMPAETTVLFFDSVAFDINNSNANDQISVVARYNDRNLLRGGWLDGEKHLVQRAALLDVGYGKGRIAMIGFRAQNRAQAYGTFKVLFNALYQAGAVKVPARAAPATALASAVPSSVPPAQTTPDRYHQKFQPVLERMIREQELPGFAIAVVEDNRLAYAAGFGVRNVTGKDDPITTRSLFHMASITKTFVATSIMQLVENGKIDLDTPVIQFLPYFRMADERYKTITVRQMVTHTSGMPDVDDYEWEKPQYGEGALENYVRSLGTLRLDFAPGERFKYSNMAFEILGDVVAKVSGETFDDYVQRHILAPLRMNDSTLLVKQADPTLLAWGHELDENGSPFPSKVYPYNRIHTPSSNLHSNVLDMARWAIANMNRGELEGARVLKASAYDVMWKPAAEFGGKPSPTGISWFLSEYRGNRLVQHGGGDTGFLTGLAMLPEKKIAVVWMTNAEWLPNTAAVTHAALDAALGLEPAPIGGQRSIRGAILSTYNERGIEAAIRQYGTLRKLRPDLYDFGVGQLNGAGRYVLGKGRLKDAIRLFELNAAVYPSSADTFDLLGEAAEKDGNPEAAIRSYQKALELDPGQAHAAEGVKRLKK